MKNFATRLMLAVAIIFVGLSISQAQDAPKKMVSIPEDQLTEQQKAQIATAQKLAQTGQVLETAHGWVGIGKELGQAFDSALASLTNRSNEFANTKVGKFTMFIVAWKVMGDQAVQLVSAVTHIALGILELAVFMPFWLWSYRKNCMTVRTLSAIEGPFWNRKKTWAVKPYNTSDFNEFTPRHGHCLALAVFTAIWIISTFSY